MITKWIKKHLQFIAIVSIILGTTILAILPVPSQLTITEGIDAFEYHAPIGASHTQSQTIFTTHPLKALDILLVSLSDSVKTPDVQITITDITGEHRYASTIVPGQTIQDDTFEKITFPQPLIFIDDGARITLSAPNTAPNNLVGIRFNPNNVFSDGYHSDESGFADGDLAIRLHEQVPLWQAVERLIINQPQQATNLGLAISLSIIASLLALRVGWKKSHPQLKRLIEISLLLTIALIAIIARLIILPSLDGVSGGDPYNYLFITDKIASFSNPFEGVKRLPGYPLLLLPAYLSNIDDQMWMRLLNILSAGGIIASLGLLSRRLRLPWSVQIISAILLAFQKDFFWLSLRPEAYSVYALLLVISLILFFSLNRLRQQIAFGLILGYAAMTRQEGFVLALILGLSALAHLGWCFFIQIKTKNSHKHQLTRLARSYLIAFAPALLLVLPFFINNAIAYGNPIYTPYFAGDRLQIVDSWPAFTDAVGATWGILDTLWKSAWEHQERLPLNSSLFSTSALLTILWWTYHRHRLNKKSTSIEHWLIIIASLLLITYSITYYLIGTVHLNGPMVVITSAALIMSPFAFLTTARWRGLVVLLVLLSQLGIATWFHPFPKHFQQSYPLIVLVLTTLLIADSNHRAFKRLAIGASYCAILFPLALAQINLYDNSNRNAIIDDYNSDAALDSVVYRAIQTTHGLTGPYGIDKTYLPAELYFKDHISYYANAASTTPQQEFEWLKEHHIKTLIITNNTPAFLQPNPAWHLIETFKAAGNNDEIFQSQVYQIPEELYN